MSRFTFAPRPSGLKTLVTFGLLVALIASAALPVAACPPPWAPAHGWRAKHYDQDQDKRYRKHAYKRRHEHQRYDDRDEKERYADYQAPYDLDLGRCNRAVLGGVLGGAAGAALGSRVGKHDGRTAAIVGGTIIGVLVGGAVGQYMDSIDQNCIGQTLEHVPDSETIVWQNPNLGRSYQVTPTETYQRDDGRYCREYITELEIGGRRQQAYGTACRQPDGSWKVVRS